MNLSPTPDPSALTLPRRRLPIGIQAFAKLREQNCYYVNKTALAMQLIDSGTYYFLSRPRRFGKSLFLNTLRDMLEGKQALFKGLAAEVDANRAAISSDLTLKHCSQPTYPSSPTCPTPPYS